MPNVLARLKKMLFAVGLGISLSLSVNLTVPLTAFASPYVEVGDSHLRNSIQLLADGGFLRGPMNTFPMSWAPIVRDIQQLNPNELNEAQYEAYVRVMAALEFHSRGGYQALKLQARSDVGLLNRFTNAMYEDGSVSYANEIQGDHVAVRIQTQFRHEGEGGDNYNFDGSYIAATFGNWGLSFDQLAMWWGPGEDQALLHSNNARPIQALRLTRLGNEPFKLPLLSRLGHWSATAYVGRNENAGALGHHQVAGARFSVAPTRSLELGASYTGQWGGNDDLLLPGATKNTAALRNQYASLDVRFTLFSYLGLYGEYMQSQRERSPSAHLLGADLRFSQGKALSNVFVELTRIGHIYDDPIDPAGYRRWGRAVGAAIDQDTNGFAIGYNYYQSAGNGVELRLRRFELGEGNRWLQQSYALQPNITGLEVERLSASVMYQHPLLNSLIRVGVEHWQDSVNSSGQLLNINADSDTNLYMSWEYRW